MDREDYTKQDLLQRLNEYIEAHLANEHFGVSELAHKMGMSRSNLHRKVKEQAKVSASQYLRQYRLKRSMEMLRQTSFSVSEIAYQTGFGSPSYFVKCFHDYFGFPPGKVGKRNTDATEEVTHYYLKNGKRIYLFATVFLLSMVVAGIIFFIIRREVLFQPDEKEKSIAILPFLDDSPEKGSTYIINGLCDEILDKLQKFEDFSVRSRTDMEKYRGSHKDIRQIGKELHVNYILEGSGQKINNAIKLRLQLIEAESGRHLWSQTYEEDTENIFALQENVAFSVAAELQTELSPEEKREVVKRSTENMAAYNLYLQGLEHFRLGDLATKTSDWSQSQMENKKGMKFFEEAVLYDSGFSDAYVQLSHYYIDKIFNNSYQIEYKKNCLDSGLYYAEKALQYDPEHEWALALKERYFCRTGRFEEAGKIRNKRNIHPVETYSHAEVLLSDYYEYLDFYNVLKYYFLYEQLKPDDVVTPLYMDSWVFNILSTSGHRKQAIRILDKILSQNSDTLGYILGMSNLEMTEGNFNISLEYCYKALDIDSTNLNALYNIMGNYLFLQQYAKSFEYLQKMVNYESGMTIPVYPGYVEGFAYLKNGQIVKAEALFRQNAKLMLGEIKANMPAAQRYVSHFYVFADLYALGEKEKAMEYLQRLKNMKNIPHLFIVDLDKWPGFFELHDDPVYIEVKKTVEARYQEEHDRIGQLLSEVGEIE